MLKIKKSTTYRLRVNVTLPGDDPDTPQEGSFLVEVPVPTRTFVGQVEKLQKEGQLDKLHSQVILGVSGIGPNDDEEYEPAEQLRMVRDDFRLANAVLAAYRDDISKVSRKN